MHPGGNVTLLQLKRLNRALQPPNPAEEIC